MIDTLNYFSAENVTANITRIKTAFEVCTYYVQGTNLGMLIDTGLGCGDLKSFVDSIAKTPYIVVLSHGHCDHAGGSGQFEEVYLSPLDFSLEKRHCTIEVRAHEIQHAPVNIPSTWSIEQMIPQRMTAYKPLKENELFGLGGMTVQSILVPGHTEGMMVFLIREEQVAIFGDASGENTLVCFPESTSIARHYEALKQLKHFDGLYSRILRNHGVFESELNLLNNNIATCELIMSRKDAQLPVHIHGVDAFAGKDREKLSNDEAKTGNIIYTLDKL